IHRPWIKTIVLGADCSALTALLLVSNFSGIAPAPPIARPAPQTLLAGSDSMPRMSRCPPFLGGLIAGSSEVLSSHSLSLQSSSVTKAATGCRASNGVSANARFHAEAALRTSERPRLTRVAALRDVRRRVHAKEPASGWSRRHCATRQPCAQTPGI